MKLTKEQKAECASSLDHPYGRVELVCDGRKITLNVESCKKLSYRVMTYVDGHFLGKWISGSEAHPEQKFLRKVVRPVYSASFKKKMEKAAGKRFVAQDPFYKKTVTTYMPDWASGKAAINHLCKVCESVELVSGA
jgi:hypothetical protein